MYQYLPTPYARGYLTAAVVLLFICQSATAQSLSQAKAYTFQKASTLYLVHVEDADANANMHTDHMEATGGDIPLLNWVKEAFPDKEVIPISARDYNELKGVNSKYYLSIAENVLINNTIFSNNDRVKFRMSYLYIQKGKYYNVRRVLYQIRINFGEMQSGVAPIRAKYALQALAQIIYDHADGRMMRFNDQEYRAPHFKDDLKAHTLYLRKDKLPADLQSEQAVAGAYKHNFKLVSQAQWEAAINDKQPSIIFIEHVYEPWYSAFNVYRASDGVMLANSFPYKNYDKYDKKLFRRLLK